MTSWFRARMLPAGLALAFGVAWLAIGLSPARAATLSGDTIDGTLNYCSLGNGGNQFTPTSGQAPLAFQVSDGSNTYTATFSDTELTVEADVTDFSCGFGMSFVDTTTAFPTFTLVSDNYSPDLTYQLGGDGTIDISWAGTPDYQDSVYSPGDFTAVFNIDGSIDTPEPASLALLGVALVGVALIRRRGQAAPEPAA